MDALLKAELKALIKQADGFDRSWSITQGSAAEERCLMFFDMTPSSVRSLERAGQLLGMSNGAISQWRDLLQGADAIGLGLSKSLNSIRLYAQFWDQQVERVMSENLEPFAVYFGIKSLPDGTLRKDTYMCEPLFPKAAYWPKVETACTAFSIDSTLLTHAMPDLNDANGVWTTIEGSGRDSWLLTVRKSDPSSADVARALQPLKSVAPKMIDFAKTAPMLHIASGDDPVKGDFISFYFEAEVEDITQFLGL